MRETPKQRTDRLKDMKRRVELMVKPGDTIERTIGRVDTYLGLFEHEKDWNFSTYGWYALIEFTEARGHQVKIKMNLATVCESLENGTWKILNRGEHA